MDRAEDKKGAAPRGIADLLEDLLPMPDPRELLFKADRDVYYEKLMISTLTINDVIDALTRAKEEVSGLTPVVIIGWNGVPCPVGCIGTSSVVRVDNETKKETEVFLGLVIASEEQKNGVMKA